MVMVTVKEGEEKEDGYSIEEELKEESSSEVRKKEPVT
jgi:hypothetical protein